MARIALAAALASVGSSASNSAEWLDKHICAAGLKNYFSPRQTFEYAGTQADWTVFKGTLGQAYDCRISGDTISLKWEKSSGPMLSELTRFRVEGDLLTVWDPLSLSRFRMDNEGTALSQVD